MKNYFVLALWLLVLAVVTYPVAYITGGMKIPILHEIVHWVTLRPWIGDIWGNNGIFLTAGYMVMGGLCYFAHINSSAMKSVGLLWVAMIVSLETIEALKAVCKKWSLPSISPNEFWTAFAALFVVMFGWIAVRDKQYKITADKAFDVVLVILTILMFLVGGFTLVRL